jgi:hypothetical protein
MPLLHDAVEAVAPETILEPKGALEKACGLIIVAQLLVAASYLCEIIVAYMFFNLSIQHVHTSLTPFHFLTSTTTTTRFRYHRILGLHGHSILVP